MRETLEISRIPVAAALDPNDIYGGNNLKQAPLTMIQLLPVVQVWLRYAGDKLLRLSQDSPIGSAWARMIYPLASSPAMLESILWALMKPDLFSGSRGSRFLPRMNKNRSRKTPVTASI